MVTIDEQTHTYTHTLERRRVDGVTDTLGRVFREYDGVPDDDLVRRRDLGLAVHRACELDDLGEIHRYQLAPVILPYLDAWRAFKRELQVEVVHAERIVYSSSYDFAGRVDVLVRLGNAIAVTPIDRKVVRRISPVTRLQLAGYETAARETWRELLFSGERIAVQLLETGRPKIDGPYTSRGDQRDFLAALAISRFKQEHSLR